MIDPYKMVLINLIVSGFFIAGVLLYHKVYPKKKINLFVLLLVITLLPLISLLRKGTYESGDFNIHIYRSIEFFRSLTEGNALPAWDANQNATYGLPLFIFNYTSPYYIICLFHFFGFSFIASMKIFLGVSYFFSGIFMYLAMQKLFQNDRAAFIASLFYQFAPYHLVDLHFKIVIGEIMVFALIPAFFYTLQVLWERKTGLWFALAGLSLAILIVSHVTIALYTMVLFFGYALFFSAYTGKRYILFSTIATFLIGSISSIYMWAAPFVLGKYTILQKMNFIPLFPNFSELFYSPWRFGFLFQGHKGEISPLLGYSHIFAIIVTVGLLIKKNVKPNLRRPILFWLISFIIIIFLVSQFSAFIWNAIPFLKTTGGSHRLLILAAFVSSIIAGYLSLHFIKNNKLVWAFIGFTILSTILNWGHRQMIVGRTDQYYTDTMWSSTYLFDGHYYANTKWRNVEKPWFTKLPKVHLKSGNGSPEIKELKRTSTSHSYVLSASTENIYEESTLYFPGWQVFDNNKPIPTRPDTEGIITFKLSKGLHYVEVRYEDIFIYRLLKFISTAGLSGIVLIILYDLVRKSKSKKLLRKS